MLKKNNARTHIIIVSIAMCCIILLCINACRQPTYYPPNTYTSEEVQQLFVDNKEAFAEVAQILLDNDEAYKHREPEGVSKLLLHSNEKRYRRYFDKQEYEQIDEFFRVFRPYSLERGYDFVMFTFYITISDEDEIDAVTILYFEEYTSFEHYSNYSQYGLIDLGDDWYFLNWNL